MAEQGHDFEAIWQQIEELVVLSLLSVQPLLQMNYRTAFPATNDGFSCFELLGYDVLLDQKCRPWLLEVHILSYFSGWWWFCIFSVFTVPMLLLNTIYRDNCLPCCDFNTAV